MTEHDALEQIKGIVAARMCSNLLGPNELRALLRVLEQLDHDKMSTAIMGLTI